MEWWHLGPLVLAVLMFLLAGSAIEQHLETAVLRMINRQPLASRATVGVETSGEQQQQSQQQQQQQQEQSPEPHQLPQQQKQQHDIPTPRPMASEKSLLHPSSKTSTIVSRPMEMQLNTKSNHPI